MHILTLLTHAINRDVLAVSALALAFLAGALAIHELPWTLARMWPFHITALAAMALAVLSFRGLSTCDVRRQQRRCHGINPDSMEFWFGVLAAAIGTLLILWAFQGFYQPDDGFREQWVVWVTGSLLATLGLYLTDRTGAATLERLRRGVVIRVDLPTVAQHSLLLLALVFATVVRVVDLDVLPAGMDLDERVKFAKSLQYGDPRIPIPPYDLDVTAPTAFMTMVHRTSELVGISIVTPRLVAAFLGVGSVLAVFLLGRRIMDWPLGLLAAAIMASLAWNINFSRIGWENIAAPLCAALAAWATLRALDTGRMGDYALAGALTASGFWFYQAYQSFPALIGAMLLYGIVRSPPDLRPRILTGAAVLGLLALAWTAPLSAYAVSKPDETLIRAQRTSLFLEQPPGEWPSILLGSAYMHLRMFHFEGDKFPAHNLPGAPMLDPVSGALILLGTALALFRWRRTGLAMLPLWIVVSIVPSLVSEWPIYTQGRRTLTVLPAVALLAALPLALAWQGTASSPRWKLIPVRIAVVTTALLVAVFGVNQYFYKQAAHPDVYQGFNTHATLMAWDVPKMLNAGYAIGVVSPVNSNVVAELLTLWPAPSPLDWPHSIPVDPSIIGDRRGLVVYMSDQEPDNLDALTRFYPGADFESAVAPGSAETLFHRAVIHRDLLWQTAGLSGKRDDVPPLLNTGLLNLHGANVWRGSLHVRTNGLYNFKLLNPDGVTVTLNDSKLLSTIEPRSAMRLTAGLHPIEINVHATAGPGAALLWQGPREDTFKPITVPHLYRGNVRSPNRRRRQYRGTGWALPTTQNQAHPAPSRAAPRPPPRLRRRSP